MKRRMNREEKRVLVLEKLQQLAYVGLLEPSIYGVARMVGYEPSTRFTDFCWWLAENGDVIVERKLDRASITGWKWTVMLPESYRKLYIKQTA